MPTGVTSSTGVAYGNGVYVSILSNGLIYRSSDGEAWSKVADGGLPAGYLNRIAFGAGIFVAVGRGGLILTSTDGLVWATRTSGTTNQLSDVQFIQSTFYAVGTNATVRSSTNGTTWNTVTLGVGAATNTLTGITYGNGIFAISARNSSGHGIYIYRSTTAASNSWTFQDVVFGSVNRVQYLKDKFYIFSSNTDVYTSTNASTWTNTTASMPVTLPNSTTTTLGSPNQVFHGIYDGSKIFLFGSSDYYVSYGSIYSSTDGTNFTLEPKTVYIVGQGAAYINNKYFQWGNEGLISSNDGVNYKYSGGSYTGLATNGTNYVGIGSVSNSGIIFSSTDFTTWTNRAPANQRELKAVTYTGTKYVAVGSQTVIESADGNTWTSVSTPSDFFTAVAFGANRLVGAGSDVSGLEYKLSYSTNGVSWTTANTDNNTYFKIRYLNGQFFAMGFSNDAYEGVIMRSNDGISWTNITPTLPYPVYYFNDVVYDGTKYHFMGMEWVDLDSYQYDDFFSVSTATVTDPASFTNKGSITSSPGVLGGSYGEGAFAYSNGRFVGAVFDLSSNVGYVIHSTNGVNWTATALNENTAIYGIVAQGNTFRMLGTGDGKVSASFAGSLPVRMIDFSASLDRGKSLLRWKTASEVNSSHFTVQHSLNGVDWANIGTVQAAGQSQAERNYDFLHASPASGVNYYRLIQIDLDGKQQLSRIIKLQVTNQMHISLFPNPAREYAQLQLPGSGVATVSVFSATGQQLYHAKHTEKTVRISLQQFANGMYKVVVQQDGQQFTQQLIRK